MFHEINHPAMGISTILGNLHIGKKNVSHETGVLALKDAWRCFSVGRRAPNCCEKGGNGKGN